MAMNSTFLGVLRDAGEGVITHIGLVNASGVELSSASYARQAVTWTDDGTNMRPSADLAFSLKAGDVVGGWRGFSAATAGTNYGGADVTNKTFGNDGTYTLLAASTSVNISAS